MGSDSDNEFATNVLNNLMETWILPAIQKRQSDGQLPTPIELRMAQIIFKLDERPPVVRVNDEVRGEAMFRAKAESEVRPGDPVYSNQIEELLSFQLPEDERDWGHATIVLSGNFRFISFDFIYNKRRSAEHLAAAREFLQAAAYALETDLIRAFVENLASASELAAKAYLLSRPDRSIMTAKSHSQIHRKLNVERRIGNVDDSHVEAFNQIHQLRYPARYLDRQFDPSSINTGALLEDIQAFIEQVEAHVQVAL